MFNKRRKYKLTKKVNIRLRTFFKKLIGRKYIII